jgi:hypothetical protein
VHLLAAMDHTSHAVLGQADVDATTNEVTRFRPLLDRLDLAETRRLQVTTVAGLDFPYAT